MQEAPNCDEECGDSLGLITGDESPVMVMTMFSKSSPVMSGETAGGDGGDGGDGLTVFYLFPETERQ